jgi:hypothetical protein
MVLSNETLPLFRIVNDGPDSAKAVLIEVNGGPVRQAWRLETLKQPADPWKFQLQATGGAGVKRGDTLWARFFMRSTGSLNETGEGLTTFVFETADEQHAKSIDLTIGAGNAWREICFPFTCRNTLDAGETLISLRAGFRPQTIEIGGVEVLNYGPDRKPNALPRTREDYPGREANAPWRAAAAERIRTLEINPQGLRQAASDRVSEMIKLTRGRFHDWDVINEPFAHNDLMRVLGDEVMADWFKQARAIDPDAVLFLNDYAGLAAGGMNTLHKDHFEKTARFLKEHGAPIGGIGLQCHFGWSVTPPETALRELDRWAKLGLEIHLTEFDIDTTDEDLQADYTRDLLTLAFSHPSVTAIMTWGFWEGRHWRPDAALWHKDWTLKPNGKAWLDLTTRDWWTSASGVTAADGSFKTRGFFGNHEVTVSLL